MKILHISSSSRGGAGRAAYRIHEALLSANQDSLFLSLEERRKQGVLPTRTSNDISQRIQWRFRHHLNIELSWRAKLKKDLFKISDNLKCEIATLPISNLQIYKSPEIENADIINLHWVATDFDYQEFFKMIKKPVIWTLHDMNPFLGLYHYRNDEERNINKSRKLDTQIKTLKKKLVSDFRYPFEIITPSVWLAREAKNSRTFANKSVTVIPYPINLERFKRRNSDLRARLNLKHDDRVILSVAQNIQNYRKGFDILIDTLEHFPDLKIILIGKKGKNNLFRPNAIYTGEIRNDELLSEYYSLADATIIPSREDNLPNVLIESFACGTPVISFNIGGMRDHIRKFETGILATEMNSESLRFAMREFFGNKGKFHPNLIRKYAEDNFNEKAIAERYLKVYNKVLNIH